MRLRRSEHDMFGRPALPQARPARRRQLARPPAAVPPGLVPFIPVIMLVVLLALIAAAPVVGVPVAVLAIVAVLAVLLRARYRQIKDVDYAELRGDDPLWRAVDAFRRGRTRWDDQDRSPK